MFKSALKRNVKHLVALAMAGLMAFCNVPLAVVLAEEADSSQTTTYGVTVRMTVNAENIASGTTMGLEWYIDGKGVLHISGNGSKERVSSYTDWGWHEYRDRVTAIDANCVLPTNCYGMFYNMTNATAISFGEHFDSSGVTDMRWMFHGCESLKELDATVFDTDMVDDMSQMFQNCSALTELDLSSWNTDAVEYAGNMFQGCTGLTSLCLDGWTMPSLKGMIAMFQDCSSLTELELPNWSLNGITTLKSVFNGCSSLETLDVSGWNTSKVQYMTWTFYDCSSLETLDLSTWDMGSVEGCEETVYGCSNLSRVKFPEAGFMAVDSIEDSEGGYVSLNDSTFTIIEMGNGVTLSGWYAMMMPVNVYRNHLTETGELVKSFEPETVYQLSLSPVEELNWDMSIGKVLAQFTAEDYSSGAYTWTYENAVTKLPDGSNASTYDNGEDEVLDLAVLISADKANSDVYMMKFTRTKETAEVTPEYKVVLPVEVELEIDETNPEYMTAEVVYTVTYVLPEDGVLTLSVPSAFTLSSVQGERVEVTVRNSCAEWTMENAEATKKEDGTYQGSGTFTLTAPTTVGEWEGSFDVKVEVSTESGD